MAKRRTDAVPSSPSRQVGKKKMEDEGLEEDGDEVRREKPQKKKKRIVYQFGPPKSAVGATSTPLKMVKIDVNCAEKKRDEEELAMTPPKVVNDSLLMPGCDDSGSSHEDRIYWVPTPQKHRTPQKPPSSPFEDVKNLHISPVNPLAEISRMCGGSLPYENLALTQTSPRQAFQRKTPSVANKSESFPPAFKSRKTTEPRRPLWKAAMSFNTPVTENTIKSRDVAALISTVENAVSAASRAKSGNTNWAVEDTPSKPMDVVRAGNDAPQVKIEISEQIQSRSKGQDQDPEDFDNSSDVFADDFSEDFMNDLDAALARPSQVLLSNPTKAGQKNSIDSVQEPPANFSQEDDDFGTFDSDDDDMLDSLLLAKTQVQPKTKVEILNTQQRVIETADREGSLVFKRNIEDTDNNVDIFKKEDVNLAKSAVERDGIKRFEVMNVMNTFYVVKGGMKKPQKLLTVRDSKGESHKIFVRDMWETLDIQPRDVIHIVGENSRIVDANSHNLLVWNPDILLSATLVSDTISCDRRSVLKTKLDFPGEYNVFLLVGEIVHCVFQYVLKEHFCSMELMQQEMERQLQDNMLTILTIGETTASVRAQVMEHLPYINTWFELYVKERPSSSASIKINKYKERTLFATSNIIDIEENIWSPAYGLRGLIDVTIEAFLDNQNTKGKFVAPMELKSGGRALVSHKAQAALYTLLMKDRYEMDVQFFMLVYTKLKETTKHEIDQRELKDLMMLRNRLSKYLREGTSELPEIKRQSQCDRCYAVEGCMTINKLTESGTDELSGLPNGMFDNMTGHLDNPKYKEFYHKWDDLVTKEEGTINLLKKDLFAVDGETREKTSGKCLSNLVIDNFEDDTNDENDSYIYTFKRKMDGLSPLNLSQLAKHDRIIVSDEAGHFGLCFGFIKYLREDAISISTNRRLRNNVVKSKGFNIENNQTFQTVLRPLQDSQGINPEITFRIDKDEMFHGMRLARYNILNLFLRDGDSRRRELIVDDVAPRFEPQPLPFTLEQGHTFNEDQIKAFEKVLSTKDYSLLLGMPGTGKTTVIAQLIKFLVKNKKTVLLTAYTHSAVDNILMKIKGEDFGVVRLGNLSRVHKETQVFSPYKKDVKTAKDLQEVFLDPPVVATTCLGINEWIFNRRKFDYCIVDESSQVSMPVCLGPLRFCDKFVLVGDHFQLPPLVQNPEAKAGLSKSLFKILSERHPESVVDLTHQYRMCSDIMLLSNTLIYEGRLKCGSEMVANLSLKIPFIEKLITTFPDGLSPAQRWLDTVLDSNNRVLFLNHDEVGGCQETSSKENIENPKEAELVFQIVEAMILCGVPEKSIGVMSFYRAQLRLFYRKFSARKDVEMLTADQFQGRDKDCVIISLVKSNNNNNIGSLLKEWRRVNVAITRAKSKLIIIGSKRTLKNLSTLDAFMKILDSRGWFYDLPPKADTFYTFKTPSTKHGDVTISPVKKMKDSRVVQSKPLAREIAEEMDL